MPENLYCNLNNSNKILSCRFYAQTSEKWRSWVFFGQYCLPASDHKYFILSSVYYLEQFKINVIERSILRFMYISFPSLGL